MTSRRPLSPHFQVYKPQLTSVLSITHRATGVALALGTPLLSGWLWALASGDEMFIAVQTWLASGVGRLLLLLWTFALFYHLCNGVRHLFWDIGWGFELPTVYRSGWVVVIASMIFTLAAWFAGYAIRGDVL